MEERAERVSVETYLAMDAEAEGKLERLNGVVVAMAGASPLHNQIVGNVARALGNGLEDSTCRVLTQAQRVQVEATGACLYPDVVVIRGEACFDTSARPASLLNPSAVVEVLSESTLDHDLGAKLGHYRRIPSVREILFVHTSGRSATLVTREGDGSWRLVDRGPEGGVDLSGVSLTLDAVYARTEGLPS
ncbi:MAG: Uma2 family endonuclease [Myxococcota bacterium]